jgi:tRNA wybutosine-synthesizing protein 3
MNLWASFREGKLSELEGFKKEKKVDERALGVIDGINSNPSLVTSSSCSGRIVLLEISEKKGDAHFFGKWHREVEFEEAWSLLASYGGKRKVWFRCEPFILHVFSENLASAQALLKLARKAGFKRGGIWGFRNSWPFLEFMGTDEFSLPVFDGEMLVSKEHFSYLVKQANKTLSRNYARLERFEKELSETQ